MSDIAEKTFAEVTAQRLAKEVADLRAELDAANASKLAQWVRPSQVEYGALVVALALFVALLLGIFRDAPEIIIVMWAAWAVSLATFFVLYCRRSSAAKKLKATGVQELENQLREKSAELARTHH